MTGSAEHVLRRKEAMAQGLKLYFTGKPCARGHIAERAVRTGICLFCRNEISKKWKEANRERVMERRKQWREENPECDKKWREENREWIRERGQKHYRKNRERLRAYWQGHYAQNRETERDRKKKWDAENRERIKSRNQKRYAQKRDLITERNKRWQIENPEKVKAFLHKRRALKRKSTEHFTAEDLVSILKAQGHKCVYCQANLKKVKKHIDHIKPLAKGGSNGRKNIQYLCARCNQTKNAKDPIEFAREIGMLC